MVCAFYVPVLGDVGKFGVGHSDFFSLENIRCSSEHVDDGSKHFGGFFPVCSFVSEAGYDSWLVVVAPEDCVPCVVLFHSDLPVKEDLFEFSKSAGTSTHFSFPMKSTFR